MTYSLKAKSTNQTSKSIRVFECPVCGSETDIVNDPHGSLVWSCSICDWSEPFGSEQ
jgi:transcription elongation factor Elf1